MLITDANQETLDYVEKKMCDVVKELLKNWKLRQSKTKLQQSTQDAFGVVHQDITLLVALLKNVISALPTNQSELFDVQECYPGFVAWNDFWKESYAKESKDKIDLNPLANVHVYYENWVKKIGTQYSDFQKLWEIVMIRSSSEAICETVGSIMNQHCGKNRHLEPKYFNIEMFLRVNLGPMHLMENFVTDILAHDTSKNYIREEDNVNRTVTKNLNKSSTMGSYEENTEKKSRFPISFWQ